VLQRPIHNGLKVSRILIFWSRYATIKPIPHQRNDTSIQVMVPIFQRPMGGNIEGKPPIHWDSEFAVNQDKMHPAGYHRFVNGVDAREQVMGCIKYSCSFSPQS